ncbi:MAG: alpha-glucan family phosphorylase [Anaerolineae bacterium]|nr:alpha-glucan family phosphorylase [Anaerolineae bacterium]
MIKPVTTVTVVPNLPPGLERLRELAYNLRWSWDHETIALFRRLDRDLWERTGRNPVWMLGLISQQQLAAAAADEAFMAHLDRVCQSFDRYMDENTATWYSKHYGQRPATPLIAYFSTEFGLTECLRNYSGGLGVLSGDHLKSASDLGLPLVGVGVLYQEGYFSQYLNADGYQQEAYPINDYANQPVSRVMDKHNKPMLVSVPMPGRALYAQIWLVQVGRISLYLLDTNIPENKLDEDRNLTDRLYGGDRRQRIRQEFLLGIGGIQALQLLGLNPSVYHMNEGHSAFMGLERIRLMMQAHPGLTFQQARDICRTGNVFTTHTPVAAGLERFGFDLIDEHFGYMWQALGLTREQFIDLGRENMGSYELYSMAVLAINLSSAANGVSKLHGAVSRDMWQWMYPGLPKDEVPIGHVTNGIHVETWTSRDMGTLFDRYLDPSWREDPSNPDTWWDVDKIPDAELWRTHERRRERLVGFCRQRLRQQLEGRGAAQSEIKDADEVLNPDALTIGFARRFATYKRATLIFQDRARLARLLNNPDRPVQFIFAGKAHPHDIPGKELIKEIISIARLPEFRHKIVFLENYDMEIARAMTQGVDIWLNNPRRPKEASGTSGMKVIYNGGLNVSTLDGWWVEGYDPSVGWAIGNGEEYPESQEALQDTIEAQALYNLLEQDIIPLFYEKSRDGLPRGWIERVKNSIRKMAPFFNTARMVIEYTEQYYIPARDAYERLTQPDLSRGIAFSQWKQKLADAWPGVKVVRVETSSSELKIGSEQEVTAWVELGKLTPSDVTVQLYYGTLNTHGEILSGDTINMTPAPSPDGAGNTVYKFSTSLSYRTTGQHGVSVRVLPCHEDLPTPFQRGIIRWA